MPTFVGMTLLLAGCAGLEPVHEPAPEAPARRAQPAPRPYFQTYESLHFVVKAGSYDRARIAAGVCEEIYGKIMFDTNLLSFKPRQNYLVHIFNNREEYSLETGYPDWSGGGAVTKLMGQVLPGERESEARTSIYTFEPVATPPLLAHEVTHLVFNEFMEFRTLEHADQVRWLNEGLATYEELQFQSPARRDELLRVTGPLLRANAYPLKDAIEFRPFNARVMILGSYTYNGRTHHFTNIDVWYWQVRSLTEFLIQKEGRYDFYQLLNALKQRKGTVQALTQAYPGRWRGLDDLEAEWKQNLK